MAENEHFTRIEVNSRRSSRPNYRLTPKHIASCHSSHNYAPTDRLVLLQNDDGDDVSRSGLSPSPASRDGDSMARLPSPTDSYAQLLQDGGRPLTSRRHEWQDRVQLYLANQPRTQNAPEETQQEQSIDSRSESIPHLLRRVSDGARSVKSEASSHPSRLPEPVPVLPAPTIADEEAEAETSGPNKLKKSSPSSKLGSGKGLDNMEHIKGILKSPTAPKHSGGYLTSIRFWLVMIGVCLAGVISAVEATILSTALPTIINELQGGELYMWAANAYFLSSAVFQPLYAQAARLFNRQCLALLSIGLFAAGASICGAATNVQILILGRTVQGFGGSGITTLVNFIIADLVPIKSRGRFLAVTFTAFTVGNGIGPFLGGLIVEQIGWQWIFWVTLPPSALSFLLILCFHRVYGETQPALPKLKCIDYIGYIIFIGSMIALLFAVTVSGTTARGMDWHQIVPLGIGALGFVAFMLHESSSHCKEPIVPPRLFANRTSASAFVMSFLHSMATIWAIYWLPIYFQGVQGSGPFWAGVQLLPTVLVLVPFAALSSKLLEWVGYYRPLHFIGFALMTIGFAMFALFSLDTPSAQWIGFQVLLAAGGGLVVSSLLPAVQAGLPETDRVAAISTWGFIRNFGILWGVAVPSALFNNQFNSVSGLITDEVVRSRMLEGRAYELATAAFLNTLSPDTAMQVKQAYSASLRSVWFAAAAVAGIAFLLILFETDIRVCRRSKMPHKDDMDPNQSTEALEISSPQKSETVVNSPIKPNTTGAGSPLRSGTTEQISPLTPDLEAGQTTMHPPLAERLDEKKNAFDTDNAPRNDVSETVHVFMESAVRGPRSKYNPVGTSGYHIPSIPPIPAEYGPPKPVRMPFNLKNSWSPWGRRSRYESWYSSGTDRSEWSDRTRDRQSTGSEWGQRVSRLMEELEIGDELSTFGEWESSRRSNSSLNF